MCSRPKISTTTAAAPAAVAVSAPPPVVGKETEVDSTGESIKRKARGKNSLTIASTISGGGANGGTGLNI